MLLDFRSQNDKAIYDADVCIVGSGAAGLSLASALAGRLRVLVVEAGGRHPPRAGLDALAGEAVDWPFAGFTKGRTRAFGGATRLWAGQCLRLDPIDFAKRDWVPHSGWPITAAELDPWYARAEAFVGLNAAVYDSSTWRRFGIDDPALDGAEVQPRFTVYMPQPDFARAFRRHLVSGSGAEVDVLLNAAVTAVELDGNGHRVNGVSIRGEDGRTGQVRARAVVLCGGGIDNPRLLLASNGVMADGIGNAHGLVGRFFQDHPSATTGLVDTPHPRRLQNQFRKLRRSRRQYWPKLALTEQAQREGRLLNANAIMLYDYDAGSALSQAKQAIEAAQSRRPLAVAARGLRLIPHLPELAARAVHTVATGKAPAFAPSRVMLKSHVEQRPDPENRVTLSAERDRYGLPLPRLAWRVHPEELRTMRGVTEAIGRTFARLGWGTVTVAPWLEAGEDAARAQMEDTYHHAGTTRMGASPAEGVVDAHGLVFGTDNLYVAGSSVFPTSGYANPTLTIVALAMRLADTLGERLARREQVET